MHTQRKVPKRNGARRLVRYANSLDSRFSWRSPKLASLRSLGQGFASSSKSCESRLRLTGIENLVNILINKHVLNKWIEGIKPLRVRHEHRLYLTQRRAHREVRAFFTATGSRVEKPLKSNTRGAVAKHPGWPPFWVLFLGQARKSTSLMKSEMKN